MTPWVPVSPLMRQTSKNPSIFSFTAANGLHVALLVHGASTATSWRSGRFASAETSA